MQTLHTLLTLKKLYLLQALGMKYCNPQPTIHPKNSFKISNPTTLQKLIQECQLCPQKSSAPHIGLCNLESKITFLSLTPILDTQLRFASKSSQMLKKIIENVLLLSIKEVSILSLLKCELPKISQYQCYQSCKDYLLKQLEFSQNKLIVLLGEEVYRFFCDDKTPYENLQGKSLKWGDFLLFPTFSLMQLLSQPQLKVQAYQEFLTLKGYL
ncbi:uracil-DNA glycosylase family protein [Helicobacter mesocricetorum]|uniref:uracil-DNA glycosylase family protein n=1 Tax=Helicobacter mesocricetorum TaxID=87012 RepID=UPI000CF09396|nr:uracil-DNA glycosylase family protein [Helicobacter mesocricetorum]